MYNVEREAAVKLNDIIRFDILSNGISFMHINDPNIVRLVPSKSDRLVYHLYIRDKYIVSYRYDNKLEQQWNRYYCSCNQY